LNHEYQAPICTGGGFRPIAAYIDEQDPQADKTLPDYNIDIKANFMADYAAMVAD
jgi:hypothetical protein